MARLKISHVNIRSLIPSLNEVKEILNKHNFDIMGITETWLSDNENVNVPNYKFYRVNRPTRGGGVGVFINKKFKVEILSDTYNEPSMEYLLFNLKLPRISFGCGVFYRPPTQQIARGLELFEDCISNLLPVSDELILLGDFNINLNSLNSVTENFLELLHGYNLEQIVNNNTRTNKNSSSLIDLIIVSNSELFDPVLQEPMHEISDHDLVYVNANVKVLKSPPKLFSFRNFKYFQLEEFQQTLESKNWQMLYNVDEVESKVSLLTQNIINSFDIHAPIMTVKVSKPKSPWITDVIKIMIRERNKLLTKFKKTKQPDHWEAYKTMRNYVVNAIRQEKQAYLNNICRTGDSKQIWNTLDRLNIHSKANKLDLPQNLSDVEQINNFFTSGMNFNLPISVETINKYNTSRLGDNFFTFREITENDIFIALKSLKTNCSGHEGLTRQMINICCPFIVPYLCHIFNSCLASGYFPKSWKKAIVLPLPKVNQPESFSDLRPISLLPVLSKLFEKILHRQMFCFMNNNNLLAKYQSGFRKGYSSVTALLNVQDDILTAVDKGMTTALVLLDYSKAFDTIDHSLLCAKLHYYGFSDSAVSFIRNYLTERFQAVKLKSSISGEVMLSKGVPQGSVLGPLLFIIFTSDMGDNLKYCKHHQYADDTQLYISFNKDTAYEKQCNLNADLDNIYTYSICNGLKINPTKSAVIFFGPHKLWANDNFKLRMSNSALNSDKEVKNLGIIFDNELRFRAHIAKILQKCYMSLRHLFRNRNIINFKFKIALCESLVLSHLNYGDIIYCFALDQMSQLRLQKIQNTCIRFIYSLRSYDHVSHKLKELKWLNIKNRQKHHLGMFIFKTLKTGVPCYLKEKLEFRHTLHNSNLRVNYNLNIPKHRTSLYRRSFSYSAANVFNKFPIMLKNSNLSLKTIKIKLFEYLIQEQ